MPGFLFAFRVMHKMRQLQLLLAAVLLASTAVESVADGIQITGPTMGTIYKIVVDSPPADLDAEALQLKIEERLDEINRQMSTWDSASEISTFNAQESTDWFPISAEFARVTSEAKRIFELTNGAFDPTVEPLIKLWGFGDKREQRVPGEADIAAAMKIIGMQHLAVRMQPPALKKSIPQLQLNLSAIAKGYAVDAISELLTAEGLPSHVVDIGGENKAGTAKASGDKWKLGVESPLGGLQRIVKVTEASIATSGDYRNFFEMEGVVYSHAIDPTTGWPVKSPPASVSVVDKSCMLADSWATAMMILGTQQGSEIAEANQLSVLFQEVQLDKSVKQTAHGLFTTNAVVSVPNQANAPTDDAATNGTASKETANSMPWFPFAAAAVIFLIAIGGMAIGTMLQNKSLKGSCGGLASMPGSEGKSICELCTIPKDQCTNEELKKQMQAAAAKSADEV